jgi:hypothetical protein
MLACKQQTEGLKGGRVGGGMGGKTKGFIEPEGSRWAVCEVWAVTWAEGWT